MSWGQAHEAGAWVLVGGNAAVGVWCLGAHARERLRRPHLWWAVIAAQALVFVEAALGVILMNVEDLEPADLPDRHVLYGVSAIMAIAILYGYRSTSPWVKEREHLVFAGGSLFIMGLGLMEIFAL